MKLLLIGCGNIGRALLTIWGPLPWLTHIVVVQPSMRCAKAFSAYPAISFVSRIDEIAADFREDLTVLAVKPQMIHQVIPALAQRSSQATIVSMLAGIQLAQLSAWMPAHAKIIRIMPNLAIKTGKSVNLAFSLQNLSVPARQRIEQVFVPSGQVTWMNAEKYLDLLTPISGSGPAYFFLLAETLLSETIKLGLDEATARKLVQEILLGSASLVEENTDYAGLIESVASKKGATEAALQIMRPGIESTMAAAIEAALTRVKELADENSR